MESLSLEVVGDIGKGGGSAGGGKGHAVEGEGEV